MELPRFVGMGGCYGGALGGDISTIGGPNPAGIGLYHGSDIMTSFGFSSYGGEKARPLGSKWNSDKTGASFDNIGFVFSSKDRKHYSPYALIMNFWI